jgi:hypothetical protein
MYCPGCGNQVGEADRFCSNCGKRLLGAADPDDNVDGGNRGTLLLSFGPFGVTVCDGPYSMYKWQRKNVTIVELTNTGIYGIPNKKFGLFKLPAQRLPFAGRVQFEIPYASITSVQVYPHPAQLGLMNVLDIQYREDDRVSEKSICSYLNNIRRAEEVILSDRPGLRSSQ